MMKINILGTDYKITLKKYDEDEAFDRCSFCGYCDGYSKEIVVCDMHTYKGWENEPKESIIQAQKETLRHEIVHAFLNESGLSCNGHSTQYSWAKDEEIVDWIAIQGVKIYKAWTEVDAV